MHRGGEIHGHVCSEFSLTGLADSIGASALSQEVCTRSLVLVCPNL